MIYTIFEQRMLTNMIGLILLFILLIFVSSNYFISKRTINIFKITIVINILLIVFNNVDYILSQCDFESAYIFRTITTTFGYSLTPLLPYTMYILTSKKSKFYFAIPVIINCLIAIISAFVPIMFLITKENSFNPKALNTMPTILAFFYIALIVIDMLIHNDYPKIRNEALCIAVMCAAIVSALILEMIFDQRFVTWNVTACVIVFYYLLLHVHVTQIDELTGVLNRNMFNKDMENIKNKSVYYYVVIDLDRLKYINDNYGHDSGDKALTLLAHDLKQAFVKENIYRIGGDEFFICIKKIDKMGGYFKTFNQLLKSQNIHASYGIVKKDSFITHEEAFNIADYKMYIAKKRYHFKHDNN